MVTKDLNDYSIFICRSSPNVADIPMQQHSINAVNYMVCFNFNNQSDRTEFLEYKFTTTTHQSNPKIYETSIKIIGKRERIASAAEAKMSES